MRGRGAGQFTTELNLHGTRGLAVSRLCAPGVSSVPPGRETALATTWAGGPHAPRVRGRFLLFQAMRYCPRCDNRRWVSEAHRELPWEGPRACGCGAPGEPCPVCNRVEGDQIPELPEGFRVDIDGKGWRH